MSTLPTTNEMPSPDPPSRILDNGDTVEGDGVVENTKFEILGHEIDADEGPDQSIEPQFELPSFVVGSGFEAVRSLDFQRIGVEEHETRIMVIRSAARRRTAAIWGSAPPDQTQDVADQVANVLWTTYRLIDPRFRNSSFQQIRVGRILPLVLSYAACMDLECSNEPISDDQTPSLFGHRMAVVAPPFIRSREPASDTRRTTLSIRPKRADANSSRDGNEAMQTYAELRSFSATSMWQTIVHDKRFLVGLIATTSATAVFLLIYAIRFSMPTPEVIAQTASHQLPTEPAKLPDTIKHSDTLEPSATPGSSELLDSEVLPAPVLSSNDLTPVIPVPVIPVAPVPMPAIDLLPVDPASTEPPLAQNPMPATQPDASQTDELLAALAKAIDGSEAELSSQLDELSSNSDDVMPMIAKDVVPIKQPAFNSDEVITAADNLWRNTPSAARQFTGVTAKTLIDQWDFEAELSGFGTLEHAAASRLSLQAAWLVEPLSMIIARLRDHGPVLDVEVIPTDPAADDPDGLTCCHLPLQDLTILIESWRAARKRVVITDDLNQMLHQGTVLIDRILVSDRLQPIQRAELIEPLLIDVTRLAALAKDETLLAEFQEITDAMSSFPDASEFSRLEETDDVSGFLGRVRCLKQRQWQKGLSSLTKTAEPALASCAKAEWELLQTQSATPEAMAQIAERWSKIAVRLPPREAASVRLHALELYGNVPQYAKERQQLLMALPRYVATLTQL
ncbi:hypothetical protein [Neorhodopirellula pilleata]|nr:hypothetical protein [Neorhodopirellula pilleata]